MGWTEETMYGRNVNEHIEHVYCDMEFVSKGYVKNHREYYRAFKDKEGNVHALIVYFSCKNGDICWKSITDSSGPVTYNCPASILDILTPTDNEYSNEWRKLCREKIKRNKLLVEGVKIKMDKPSTFFLKNEKGEYDQVDCDTFEVIRIRNGRVHSKVLKALPKNHIPFIAKIKNWKDRAFTILIDS